MPQHMNATEWLERLADAMETSRAATVAVCTDADCANEIRRGIRCEDCRKKRHAAAERARIARQKMTAKPIDPSKMLSRLRF